MKDIWWASVVFREFSSHFIEMSDEEIVRDIRASLIALVKLDDSGNSIGAAMVKIAKMRLQGSAAKTSQANGRKGGRPRKNPDALVSRPKSLPGTSSGNGEALNDEGATAPAGQSFEARQAIPGARHHGATGETIEEARTPRAATTPVPVSAHGNAAEGGLLTPWYGPGTGEASESATSPSDFQNRPGKSATSQGEILVATGGSERGAGGTAIDAVRRSPGAKVPEPRLRYGGAGNVLMTKTEMERLAAEFGDVRQITEELSDYLLLHPNKYRSHYAALRSWCRRRIREGRNPDGTRMTQGDRLARHFAMREKEILDGNKAEEG